ncbi:MAG: acetate--CoA ligase family protein, partial [Alphaproteobacteria bacterium]
MRSLLPTSDASVNPVYVRADADPGHFAAAARIVLDDPGVDALLVLNCPVAVASSTDAAAAVAGVVATARAEGNRKPVYAAWLGEQSVRDARKRLDEAGLPVVPTPEAAVTAFMHQVRRQELQDLLMQVPGAHDRVEAGDRQAAEAIVRAVLAEGREWLNPLEATALLRNYGIPVVDLRVAATPEEAQKLATQMGFPVALKIMSPDVLHKSDVGAVVLNLRDGPAVARAAATMLLRLAELQPGARIEGFMVQPMASRPGAHELIVGLSEDPLFGPVLMFGQGGTAVEVVRDQALALPPLDAALARDLVARTRVASLLRGYRDRPPANMDAILRTILAVQAMAVDLPALKELDINPLWANEQGVLALDARMRVAPEPRPGTQRVAVRPYPAELTRHLTDREGKTYLLRPIWPEDATALKAAIAGSNPD